MRKLNAGGMNKFGTRTEYEPVTHIDGVAVADIMAAHGSPVFVLSERMIRNLYRQSLQAFSTRYPKVQFAWSYKPTTWMRFVASSIRKAAGQKWSADLNMKKPWVTESRVTGYCSTDRKKRRPNCAVP